MTCQRQVDVRCCSCVRDGCNGVKQVSSLQPGGYPSMNEGIFAGIAHLAGATGGMRGAPVGKRVTAKPREVAPVDSETIVRLLQHRVPEAGGVPHNDVSMRSSA